jgi:hypothetical protein
VRSHPDISLQGPLQARIGMPWTGVARGVRITLHGVETLSDLARVGREQDRRACRCTVFSARLAMITFR